MPTRVLSLASRVPTLSQDVVSHSRIPHTQQEKSGGSFSEMEACARLDSSGKDASLPLPHQEQAKCFSEYVCG